MVLEQFSKGFSILFSHLFEGLERVAVGGGLVRDKREQW